MPVGDVVEQTISLVSISHQSDLSRCVNPSQLEVFNHLFNLLCLPTLGIWFTIVEITFEITLASNYNQRILSISSLQEITSITRPASPQTET